jgi:hypothetical protein
VNTMALFRIAVLGLLGCLLAACGGGGGGGSSTSESPAGQGEFRLSLDRSALTFQTTAGSASPSLTTQTIVATWTGTPPDPVYVTATVEGAGIDPMVPTRITQSSATATVSVAAGLAPGTYTGRINFLVCRDAACNQPVGGSPLPVNFTVNVAAGPGPVTPPPTGGGSDAGDFVLGTTNVTFSARRADTAPDSTIVAVHLLNSQRANVNAVFLTNAPDWLDVSISGQAPDYQLTLRVTSTEQAVGNHLAVLEVRTVDPAGNVLRRQSIDITLQIVDSMSTSATNVAPSFVLGSSASTSLSTISLTVHSSMSWNITSDAPWASPSVSSGAGSASIGVTIDAANLDLGNYVGHIRIANASDPSNSISVPYYVTIVPPTLSIAGGPVVIGGDDGLGSTGSIALSLNTGANTYPWTTTAATVSGDAWLTPAGSGQVGSAPTNIVIDADRSLVDAGRHDGTVSVQVNVRGHTYSRTVPVVLRKEGHWLQVSTRGAAFSSFPSRSVLTRSVQVASSQRRTDVPWSATSDASWLTVTASGVTGGTLQLAADPAGMSHDTTHIATVTIASSDPEIENQESIRVALWTSATDPHDQSIGANEVFPVANPVEPWVYTNDVGASIRIYNVYTGALVNTWNMTPARIGDMAISQDGTTLFVDDVNTRAIVALDARTGAPVRTYSYSEYPESLGIAYLNVAGKATLAIGAGPIFDVGSGARHSATVDSGSSNGLLNFAVDPLSRYFYAQQRGLSFAITTQYSIKRTVLSDEDIVVAQVLGRGTGDNGQDICVSSDGARLYVAAGFPYVFSVFSTDPFQPLGNLPGKAYPNNVECGWNGLLVAGADAYYDPQDVWIYRADGTLLTSLKMGDTLNTSLRQRFVVLSGDNTRVIGSTAIPSLAFKSIPAP